MGQSWKTLLEQIQQLQLLPAADTTYLTQSHPSTETPQRALSRFVRDKKLTKYQARHLLEGRGARLRMGNYVILGPLGKGAMGRVLKARHVQMERVVAIKTLNRETATRMLANKRFENEIRFVAQLSHPNIVQAYDAGIHEGVPYLVNEYIEGIDLQQLVSKSGPLAVLTTLRYLTQAACALAYAHSNEIIHRDVKPANLMINSEGQIKLLDLGLARLSRTPQNALTDAALTDEHVIVGSCAFMAPELAKSPKAFGAATDIYSLGCTLFFLLNGRIPYVGKTYMETFIAHSQAPIPRICDPEQPLAAPLNALFQRLVAKNPQQRIQNMGEVASEFKKLSDLYQEQEGPLRSSGYHIAIPNPSVASSDSDWISVAPGPWYARRSTMIGGSVIAAACVLGTAVWYSNSKQPVDNKGAATTVYSATGNNAPPTAGSAAAPTQKSAVPRQSATKVFKVNDD